MRGLHFGNQAYTVFTIFLAIEKRSRGLLVRLVIEYQTRTRLQFGNEAHRFSKVHAKMEIENTKPCVRGKCCFVSRNFDKVLCE